MKTVISFILIFITLTVFIATSSGAPTRQILERQLKLAYGAQDPDCHGTAAEHFADKDSKNLGYVVYDSKRKAFIVALATTDDSSQVISSLTEGATLTPLNAKEQFSSLDQKLQVADVFLEPFVAIADGLLAAVNTVAAKHNETKTIIITGHAKGGALAILASAYLHLQLGDFTFYTYTFAQPRVGNTDFAEYMANKHVNRITYESDPLPILPGRFLGFSGNSVEYHVGITTGITSCEGFDDTKDTCQTGNVPSVFEGSVSDTDNYLGISREDYRSFCDHSIISIGINL